MQDAALRIWQARDRGQRFSSGLLVDVLYQAAIADMMAVGGPQALGGYDPECDARVRWLREVAAAVRDGKPPYASPDVESAVRFVLGVDVPLLEESLRRCGS